MPAKFKKTLKKIAIYYYLLLLKKQYNNIRNKYPNTYHKYLIYLNEII